MDSRILIIEDNEYFRNKMVKHLVPFGKVDEASNLKEAHELLSLSQKKASHYDVAIIDINLGETESGLDLLPLIKTLGTYSIILTDYDSERYIEKAYELGADHYLTKDDCESVISFIVKRQILNNKKDDFSNIFSRDFITCDEELRAEILSLKSRLINSKRPVLILGETGTGKGKLAKLVHQLSPHNKGSFVSVNLTSVPEHLIESELFGYAEGCGHKETHGSLELANQGALFLDDICAATLDLQKKLIKIIEEKKFYPTGKSKFIESDFLLITATHEDILKKIKDEIFRTDLFCCLNAITIEIPPLRERKEDIPLLINHFIQKGSQRIHITEGAMTKLKAFSWPGNVRELKGVVDELLTSHQGNIQEDDLPSYIRRNEFKVKYMAKNSRFVSDEQMAYLQKNGFKMLMRKFEYEVAKQCLEINDKKVIKASEFSGISIPYFYRLLQNARKENSSEQGEDDARTSN